MLSARQCIFLTLLVLMAVPGWSERSGDLFGSQLRSSRAPFRLELPEIGGPPITEVETHIRTAELRTMKLTVQEPYATTIDYGKIYTVINGESANTVCGNIKSGRDGKVITCDLESKPRFHLQSGKNVVEIYATDRENHNYYASYVLIVGRDNAGRPMFGDTSPSVLMKFSGRKFAVVIGVSKYAFHDAGLNDLQYANSDARSVRDFLLKPEGGFHPSDVLYMEDGEATTDVVRDALTRFLMKAGPGDLVFLYIAGHGSPDPFDPRKLYFLLHDTKIADMPGTALGMSELQEMLDHVVRAQRIIVFIDVCHSAGISGKRLVTGRQLVTEENNIFNLYAAKLYRETGRAVMTSSDVNEVSEEGPLWGGGHGVFTWALLEGLGGAADANGDHVIAAGELFDYISNRVHKETQFRQNPRALPGLNANFPIALVRK